MAEKLVVSRDSDRNPKPALKPEPKKKLCILGTASTMPKAPYDDDEYEIWGVSGLIDTDGCKRLDRVFEIHPWYELRSMMMLVERLKGFKGTLYLQEENEEIPNAIAFPHKAIRDKFYLDVMGDHLYVTNTVTWMILLGLLEG